MLPNLGRNLQHFSNKSGRRLMPVYRPEATMSLEQTQGATRMLQGISSAGIAGYTRFTSRANLGVGFPTAVTSDRFEMTASPAALSRSEVLGKLKKFSSSPDESTPDTTPRDFAPIGAGENLGWLLAGQNW